MNTDQIKKEADERFLCHQSIHNSIAEKAFQAGREEERERLLNQKANQHDQEVIQKRNEDISKTIISADVNSEKDFIRLEAHYSEELADLINTL